MVAPAPFLLLGPLGTCRGGADVVFRGLAVTMMASGRLHVSLFLSEKLGGKSHLGANLFVVFSGIWRFCWAKRSLLPISMETMQAPREALLRAFIMRRQAMLWRSVIMLKIEVCWQPERICNALSVRWQSGQ